MTPSEYFDAAKKALGIDSDYELAKRLEVRRGWFPEMRSGKRNVPTDLAFRLAITLKLDPAAVVADLEMQREKNEKRREFWNGFLSRVALVALLACTLAWSHSAIYADAPGAAGGLAAISAAAFFMVLVLRIIGVYDKNRVSHSES